MGTFRQDSRAWMGAVTVGWSEGQDDSLRPKEGKGGGGKEVCV